MRGNLKCYYQPVPDSTKVPAVSHVQEARSGEVIRKTNSEGFVPSAPSRAISKSFGTSDEGLALQTYIHKIAPFTSMYFKYPELWTVVLPYVSWQEPAVKQALVAVTMADRNMTSGLVMSGWGLQAIGHYNAAIRQAVKRKLSAESLLLVSVLAWLYETLNENALNSFVHLRAAQRIIQDMGNAQAASTTVSGLGELVEKVSVTVSEAEAHTRQIFVESPGNSPETPSSPSTEEGRDWLGDWSYLQLNCPLNSDPRVLYEAFAR